MKKSWLRKFGAFITSLSLGLGVAAGVTAGNKASEVRAADATDTITTSCFNLGSGYKNDVADNSSADIKSSAKYSISCNNNSGKMQMRSSKSSGLYTTSSGGTLKSITVDYDTAADLVLYGNNSAYSSVSTSGTKLCTFGSTKTSYDFGSGSYKYFSIVAGTSIAYVKSFKVVWSSDSGSGESGGGQLTDGTWEFTITKSDFTTGGYAANDGNHTSVAHLVTDTSKTATVTWTSSNVYQNQNKMQWKSGIGKIKNVTDLQKVNSVTLDTATNVSESHSNGNFTVSCGSGTGYTNSVKVNFTIGTPHSIDSISGASEVYVGKTANYTASCVKSDTITWSVQNGTGSATINSSTGVLTGGTAGTVTVKAKCAGGGEATKTITILNDTKTLQSISVSGAKSTFTKGDSFATTGLVVTGTYSHTNGDGNSQEQITTGITTSPSAGTKLNTVGPQTVTVNAGGKSTTYSINVNYAAVESIELDYEEGTLGKGGEATLPGVTIEPENANPGYSWGNPVATEGIVYTYNPSTHELAIGANNTVEGTIQFTATATGDSSKTATVVYTVQAAQIANITGVTASATGEIVAKQYVGDAFNAQGFSFAPTWSEGDHDVVEITADDISWDALVAGSNPTGTYSCADGEFTVTITGVTVVNDTLVSIAFSEGCDMTKKSYNVGDSWNFSGLSIVGTMDSGKTAPAIASSDVTFSSNDAVATSTTSITVTASYQGLTTATAKTITGIEVKEVTMTSLTVNYTGGQPVLGTDFVFAGTIKGNMSNGTQQNVSVSDVDFEVNKFIITQQTITVTHKTTGATGTFNVTYKTKDITYTTSWTRCTSTTDIVSGETYILGYEATANSGTIIPMKNTNSGTYMYSGTGDSNNGTITMSSVSSTSDYEVQLISSTEVSGAYYIKCGDKYISNENAKNSCKLVDETAKTTSFGITLGDNDVFTFKIAENASYHTLSYNTTSPRFAVYGGTQKNLVVYKKVQTASGTADIIKLNAALKSGKTFNEGATISASDFDCSTLDNLNQTKTVTATSVSPTTLAGGDNEVTVTYTASGKTWTAKVNVYATPLVQVESVTIGNKVSTLYYYGSHLDEHKFTVTVLPTNAADKTVTWSVDKTNIATIDQNGKLMPTGNGEGDVVVTATSGGISDSCTVSIKKDSVSSIAVKTNPTKLHYIEGEEFNLAGLVLTATMSSGASYDFDYNDSRITANPSILSYGNTSVTIEFDGVETTLTGISVDHRSPINITASTSTSTYAWNSTIDKASFIGEVTFNNGEVKALAELPSENILINGFDSSKAGTNYITVSYVENNVTVTSAQIAVTISNPKLTGINAGDETIQVPYATTEIGLKDYLTVVASFEDETSKEVEDYSISGFVPQTKGEQEITISYTSESVTKEVTVNVYVLDPELTGIALKSGASITVPYATTSLDNIAVVASFEDGTNRDITLADCNVSEFDSTSKETQNITVSYTVGEVTKSFNTTVAFGNPLLTGIALKEGTSITVPYATTSLDNIAVVASFEDGNTVDLTLGDCDIVEFDSSVKSTQNITVSYTVAGVTKSFDTTVSFDDPLLNGLALKEGTSINIPWATESIDNIAVVASFEDGNTVDLTLEDCVVTNYNSLSKDEQNITVSYTVAGVTEHFDTKVIHDDPLLTSITVALKEPSAEKVQVNYGASYRDFVVVSAHYEDGSSIDISDYTDDFVATNIGDNNVIIKFEGKECSLLVNVLEADIVSISVDNFDGTTPIEVAYEGDLKKFISVTGTYADTKTATITSYSVENFDNKIKTEQDVTIKFNDTISTTIKVKVLDSTIVKELNILSNDDYITYGSDYDLSNIKVQAIYTDGIVDNDFYDDNLELVGYVKNRTDVIDENVQQLYVKLGDVVSDEVELHVNLSEEITSASVEYNGGTSASVAYDSALDTSLVTGTVTFSDGHSEAFVASSFENYNPKLVGEAQTVTVIDANDASATFTVTVQPSTVIQSIEVVDSQPLNVLYNSELDLSAINLKVTYTDSHSVTSNLLDLNATVGEYSKTTLGVQNLTVSYNGAECNLAVNVEYSKIPVSIEVVGLPSSVEYKGDLSVDDFTITVIYSDHEVTGVKATSILESAGGAFNPLVVGEHSLVVSYKFSDDLTFVKNVKVTVLPSTVIAGIKIDEANTIKEVEYEKFALLTINDVKIFPVYEDEHVGTEHLSNYTIEHYDLATGEVELTVDYFGFKATFTVNVLPSHTIQSFELVEGQEFNLEYGETLEPEDIFINVTYTDGRVVENQHPTGIEEFGTVHSEFPYEVKITLDGTDWWVRINVTIEWAKEPTSIAVTTMPESVEFKGSLSVNDIVINVIYPDRTIENMHPTSINGFDPNKVGEQTITVYYYVSDTCTLSTQKTISVNPSTVIGGLIIDDSTVNEVRFEDLANYDASNVKVIGVYEDNHHTDGYLSDITIEISDTTTSGLKTVTVHYGQLTTTYSLNVLRSETISTFGIASDVDIDLEYGETLSVEEILINVTYTDGRTESMHPTSISEFGTVHSENPYIVTVFLDGTTHTEVLFVNVKLSTVVSEVNVILKDEKEFLNVGEEFSEELIDKIILTFTDGHTEEGTFKSFTSVDNIEDEVVVSKTFTISVNESSDVKGSVTLIVINSHTASITIASESANVVEGDSLTFTVSSNPNGFGVDLIWHVSDESVATIGDNGEINFTKVGQVIVWATKDGIKSNEIVVTVLERIYPVTGVSVDNNEVSLKEGEQVTIVVTVAPENASNKRVTYSIANESVAFVDGNGVLTALHEGTTVVTVTTVDGGFTATITVTVIGLPHVESVEITSNVTSLAIGDMKQLTFIVNPTDAGNKDVTWSSSNENIALVDDNGVVYALGEGEVTITLKSVDGEKTDSITIEITKERQETPEEGSESEEKKDDEKGFFGFIRKFFRALGELFRSIFGKKED